MGTGSFPGVKRPGRGADPHPHLQCRGLKKGRAIPLPTLRALVAYKGGTFTPLPMLCPGIDKFKNEQSYTSSHNNIQRGTLPLPLLYNNEEAGVGKLQLHRYM